MALSSSQELLLPRWKEVGRPQYIVPVVAGSLMLCACVLPWLNDPLGKANLAWNLPVDIGWQVRIDIFNYGLLCLVCACCSLVAAFANWHTFRQHHHFSRASGLAGCLCLLPVMLFLLQYLFADLVGINQLAQHRVQMLLIQKHLGYAVALPLIPLDPRAFSATTLQMRLELLVDQLSIGPLLPIVSGLMLIVMQRRSPAGVAGKRRGPARIFGWLLLALAFVAVFGRAPASVVCEYQAKVLLAQGNYAQALQWLDRAVVLNPLLDRMAYYHAQRGEAQYYLQPGQQSDESRLYLAASYLQQKDNLNAYRELFAVWQAHRTVPWIRDEMSTLLTNLTETVAPLSNTRGGGFTVQVVAPQTVQRNDAVALSWLQVLSYVDPTNVYSPYMIGRINYDLHNYAASGSQMAQVITLSHNGDIQSSAYTYIALSDAGQGDYIDERTILLKAVALDPSYWNNTAREELSGLR